MVTLNKHSPARRGGAARRGRTVLAAAVVAIGLTAFAQEASWEGVLQKGLQVVDEQLDAYGYELDRDLIASIPRYDDLVRYWTSVQQALEEGSIEDLAWLQPGVEASLEYLEDIPAAAPYADWLRQKADYFAVAGEVTAQEPEVVVRPPPKAPPPLVAAPRPPPAKPAPPALKQRMAHKSREPEVWKKRLANRPKPARADELVPQLKKIFRAEGLPEELVWLAEVESSMDPRARSPVGAAGLFQFMPPTAQRFGLKTGRPDERLLPDKSAQAAARYLRFLHSRFNSWPLALAAYNAGEGRVRRLLTRNSASSFEGIADDLPTETQMYVPKIAAVIELREGARLGDLPAPRG